MAWQRLELNSSDDCLGKTEGGQKNHFQQIFTSLPENAFLQPIENIVDEILFEPFGQMMAPVQADRLLR